MLVVVLSLLLTLYLIIPEALFRTIFGRHVPPRSFVLSKADTAYRALGIAFVPFILALVGCWYFSPMQNFPFPVRENSAQARRADYKLVVTALYSESKFEKSEAQFWPAFTRCVRRQGRLILWYLFAIGVEAVCAGLLAKNYAKLKGWLIYKWFADKFLFSYISEWHPLLTPYLYTDPKTTVQADILCTNDVMYQGTVSQYFARDGQLSGIFLRNPKRFDRRLYLKAQEEGKKPEKENYWRTIPSENLYFFAEKIVNMNLTYKPPLDTTFSRLLAEIFKKSVDPKKITVTLQTKRTAP